MTQGHLGIAGNHVYIGVTIITNENPTKQWFAGTWSSDQLHSITIPHEPRSFPRRPGCCYLASCCNLTKLRHKQHRRHRHNPHLVGSLESWISLPALHLDVLYIRLVYLCHLKSDTIIYKVLLNRHPSSCIDMTYQQ